MTDKISWLQKPPAEPMLFRGVSFQTLGLHRDKTHLPSPTLFPDVAEVAKACSQIRIDKSGVGTFIVYLYRVTYYLHPGLGPGLSGHLQ